ncbi:phage tail tube protein [Bacillus sp. 1NLA3E]|uniref:phage tail tube protein n=1 Tax=Bacillus sp. 1NLA3E TaxID=666686 RepID=UPI000247E64D|nr:phage tail tube protein [Bacillus sp. 1NLA3E]AGK52033.1 antigen A [Bacillus sp. 1NLA3E]
MRGVDVIIQVEGAVAGTFITIASQRGAKFTEEVDTIETTSKSSNGWKEYDYALAGWKISCDGAYVLNDAAYDKLKTAMRNKTKVKAKWSETGSSGDVETGDALVTSRELDAPYDAEVTYAFELLGTGSPTTVTNP